VVRISCICALIMAGAASPSALPASSRLFGKFQSFQLPLRFEPDAQRPGQGRTYLARGLAYAASFAGREIVLGPLHLSFPGAPGPRRISGEELLSGRSNYLLGSDPSGWRTGVSHYAKVRYEQVFPGIDVVFYGNHGQLEYDLVIQPGADLGAVRLRFDGARAMRVDVAGDLVVETAGGELRQHKPAAYEQSGGGRRTVEVSYVLKSPAEAGFRAAHRDASQVLVIDPLINYASYLGGSDLDTINAIATDAQGALYVTGEARSKDLPVASALQPKFTGSGFLPRNAFLVKVHPSGMWLEWCTYLGGQSDEGNGIALDSAGNVYVAGSTNGSFPAAPGSYRSAEAGAFVAKLNNAGSALLYTAILGGGTARSIAVDSSGAAYITGAGAASFPVTPGAFQTAYGGASVTQGDAFVAKLNAAGSALVYATFLGGSRDEQGNVIAVDSAGNAHVSGFTRSSNFPVQQAFQSAHGGNADAFVAKLNAAGSALVYSTFLGGGNDDFGQGIALDGSNAYVAGTTLSAAFPTTPGALQARFVGPVPCPVSNVGCSDAFVAKLTSAGALSYSTFLGGTRSDDAQAIAVDSAGNAWVTGRASQDFPLKNALPEGGKNEGMYLARLNSTGTALLFSSQIAPLSFPGAYDAKGLALDPAGNVYVAGGVDDRGTFTLPSFQAFANSNNTSFVLKFGVGGSLNGASFARSTLAPESAVAAFGEGFANGTASGDGVNPPTTLAGTTVRVTDSAGVESLAPLYYVSPGQVNYLLPKGIAPGPAKVVFQAGGGRSYADWVRVESVAPGLFAANASGAGVAAALALRAAADGTRTSQPVFRFDSASSELVAEPLDLGVESDVMVLSLYGTGIRGRSSESAVKVTMGGDDALVLYAGAQGQFAGLDQVNVVVPRSVIGFGLTDVALIVDGKPANTVQVNIAGLPRPRISYLRPFSAEPETSVTDFTVAGRFLTGTTLQFSPGDGISFSAPRITATSITTNVTLSAGAAVGARTLTASGPGGTSAALPFFVRARGASTAPTISNLVVNAPVPVGRDVVLTGRFDYQDPDGDLVWTGGFSNSARIRFSVPAGTGNCVMEASGSFLHNPGQTSGNVNFAARFRVGTVTIGTLTGSFVMLDAAGNASNTMRFETGGWWACGS